MALIPVLCSADLVFTITDNGDSTTDWAISGSGTSTSDGFNAVTSMNEYTTAGAGTASTSGAWTVAGAGTNSEVVNLFAQDDLYLAFSSTISSGSDLSTASGTVTFPIAFSALTLPGSSSSDGIFGSISLVAVPEPNEYAMVAGLGLLGLAAFRRRRACLS